MTDDELEELRAKRAEELAARASGNGAPDEPIHVEGEAHLAELVATYDVALVDFHADWCGPCKMLEPHLKTLAAETDAAVLKVDIDANDQLAAANGVRAVPTLHLYVDGEVAERLVGMQDPAVLRDLVTAH